MNHEVSANIGLVVSRDAEVKFLVSKVDPNSIILVIGDSVAEIALAPVTVEALRDRADDALRQSRELATIDVRSPCGHAATRC